MFSSYCVLLLILGVHSPKVCEKVGIFKMFWMGLEGVFCMFSDW